MTTWNYIMIILCLLLLAFTCLKEWQRLNRSRLVFRLLASFFAVASFACMALPLTRKITAVNVQQKQVVLLTEGFNKDSVNSFLHKHNNIPLYAIDKDVITVSENYNIQYLSLADLASLKKKVASIHVFGYGLEKDALQAVPPSSIVFHPAKAMDGVTYVNWQHKIKTGDQLLVQGNFFNTSAEEIKLIFSGYGVNLDTAIIPANKNAGFQLAAVPKQIGKAVYALTALAGKDTLEKEPVPFETVQPGNLKILILAASPDFENKFLKSWLSQNNYALVTRTTISKNKFEKTFLNTPQLPFKSITTSFLHDFNLVIADASELTAINKSELAAIESQVIQNGMGLIVKGDSAAGRSFFYSKPFPVHQDSGSNHKDVSIYIPVNNQYATVSAAEHPAYIRPQPGTRSLIEDKQSNSIVSSTIYGAGKLLYTTLNNTFTWMLSGNTKTYQAFWSYLLEACTAKTTTDKSWSITPAYPYVNKAVEINYAGNDAGTPQVQIGENFVHFIQNPDLPFQWQGTYWPQRTGWQPVMQDNSNTFWWYAYSANDWKTMTASQRIKATFQSVGANVEDSSKGVDQNMLITVPVSKKYFFMMFLCCVGFLWMEKKL